MILQIDAGNTALKWRLVEEEAEVVDRGAIIGKEIIWPPELTSRSLEGIVVSSVKGESYQLQLDRALRLYWKIHPIHAKTEKFFAGLTCSYEEPEKMGVDRWLALAAAFNEFGGPCVVFDFGTAITVDVVDGSGLHLGGHIIPGFNVQRLSLSKETSEVRFDRAIKKSSIDLGKSTLSAVNNGILVGVLGFVEAVLDGLDKKIRDKVKIIFTGGDAPLVKKYCGSNAILRPDLVFEGLDLLSYK